MFKPSSDFLLTVPRRCLFCGSVLLFMFHVCLYYTVLFVPCSFVITCWEKADLLALSCVMIPCGFVTFPYAASSQVWHMIVSIPAFCLLLYLSLVKYIVCQLVRCKYYCLWKCIRCSFKYFEQCIVKPVENGHFKKTVNWFSRQIIA